MKRMIIASVIALACSSGGSSNGDGNPLEPSPPAPPPVISVGGGYNAEVELTRSCTCGIPGCTPSGTVQLDFPEALVVTHTPGRTGANAISFTSATFEIISSLNPDGTFASLPLFSATGVTALNSASFIGQFTTGGFAGQIAFSGFVLDLEEGCDFMGTITALRTGGQNVIP